MKHKCLIRQADTRGQKSEDRGQQFLNNDFEMRKVEYEIKGRAEAEDLKMILSFFVQPCALSLFLIQLRSSPISI